MTNHLVKIAGIGALSAITLAGMSLCASTARAADDEEDNIALDADNTSEADDGATAESNDAIYRRYHRYPRYYHHYYPWRGYRHYPHYYYPPYRHFYPPYRYYRPYYDPYRYGW